MKKTMHFLLVAVAIVFGMTSCDEFKSMMDNPVSSYLELKTASVSIVPGGTYQIEASSISTAKITYESSNPDVAIVDPSGKVTALEDGEATITVRVEANDNYQAGATQFQVKVQSPLTLEAKADGKINVNYENGITLDEPIVYTIFTKEGLKKTVSITETTAIEVDKGDKVQFMSKNDHLGTPNWKYVNIRPNMECAVYGNVMSLITPEGDFNTNKTIKKPYAFLYLFGDNYLSSEKDPETGKWISKYAIVNHDKYKLVLPAITLSDRCYSYMFNNSGLTEAPELPATTLANGCYVYMFNNCINLTVAPKLPATNLAPWCYQGMFAYTGITEAPELKAEDLSKSDGCYYSMFEGCRELTKAPTELPAKKLSSQCYQNMFYGCSKLEVAPVLPAAELVSQCYCQMFYNCYKLKSLTCLATSMTSDNVTYYNATFGWLRGAGVDVEGECTFTKAASATWLNTADQWDYTSGWNVTSRWTIK